MIARFLSLTAVLGLFGGPLGGLLLKLNGWQGLAGWQWLFLLEGIPSILLAFVVFKILPDSPTHATWLSKEEKDWIAAKQEHEARTTNRVEHLTWRIALSEPRIIYLCLIFILTATGGNAVGSIVPQLIKSRSEGTWDDSFVATVLIIPAIVGAIAMTLAASHSDRTGKRRRHVVLGYFVAGVGYLLCVIAPTAWSVILALSLNALGERIAAGSYWAVTTNLLGARAAAGGIAFINSVGNLGGFFGSILMGELKQRNNGDYTPGLYLSAGLIILTSLLAFRMLRPTHSKSDPMPEMTDGVAAASQPEEHIP